MMDIVAEYRIGSNTQELRDRYQAAIYAGVPAEHHEYQFLPEGADAFKAMLHEFFPLGKKLTDLEAIMGGQARAYNPALKERTSSKGVTGVFEYYYTDRFFGTSYFFLVENGIITAVDTEPRS